jgi:hypothetical protein
VLAHAATRPARGHPETVDETHHHRSTTLRGQNFPVMNS